MSTKEKIDLLIEMNKDLKTQNKGLHQQLQSHQKQIDELIRLNAEILVNTNKIGKLYMTMICNVFIKNLS